MSNIRILIIFSFFLIIFCCLDCRNNSNFSPSQLGLTKLSVEQAIERGKKHIYPKRGQYEYRYEDGSLVAESDLVKIKKEETHIFDNYIDEDEVVRLMIIRPMNAEDSINILRFENELAKHVREKAVSYVDVDCTLRSKTLEEILVKDQNNRHNINIYDPDIDFNNLSYVVALLEQCESTNEFTTDEVKIIWLVLVHGNLRYQKKYMPLLKKYALKGLIDNRDICLLTDRMLIGQGLPQKYGTQICGSKITSDKILCKHINLDSLKQNRIDAGFNPLEDYLAQWNIDI